MFALKPSVEREERAFKFSKSSHYVQTKNFAHIIVPFCRFVPPLETWIKVWMTKVQLARPESFAPHEERGLKQVSIAK